MQTLSEGMVTKFGAQVISPVWLQGPEGCLEMEMSAQNGVESMADED